MSTREGGAEKVMELRNRQRSKRRRRRRMATEAEAEAERRMVGEESERR